MNTVDSKEIAKFEALADTWWDPNGPFKPLHKIQPLRLEFLTTHIRAHFGKTEEDRSPFSSLRILDIGCGAGLLCEPMARLGACVTGIDAAKTHILMAREHAFEMGLEIDYRHEMAENMVHTQAPFDVVLGMEVIEHTPDPALFVKSCADLVAPGGLMFLSTINRTARSYLAAIVGAEYCLRWLPKGTHQWSRFVTPEEMESYITANDMTPVARSGLVFNPLQWSWDSSHTDLSVNYMMGAERPPHPT